MAKDFVYKVAGEGDFGDLERELAKIKTALASAKGSVAAFKEELERDSKGESEYKIVIRSEYNASGSKVATASIQEVSKEYEGLLRAIRQVEKEPQKGSVTSLRQQVNEAKQARDAVAKYSSTIDGVGNRIQALDGKWSVQNQRVRELQRQLDIAGASNIWQRLSAEYDLKGFATAGQQISNFVNVFQSVSIVAGQVTAAINNVVNALGNLQTFSLAFEAVGAGAGSANLALAESTRISSGLGTDLKTVRDSFQQLSPVILKSGGSIADVSGVVETLSSRFAAYGISGDRARRVTNGVIQAFAKGKLMAEELTQQISEADPAFKTDLAGALKVTVAGLEELVKAGEITSDVFLKALLEIGKSDLLFGRLGNSAVDAANSLATAGTTVDQVRSKIATIGQLSLERFAKSVEPVVFSFLKLGAVVTDSFDRISRLQGIDSLGNIIGGISQSLVGIIEALLRFAEAGLAVIGVIAKFANVLTSIPGATEVIALAIASKLIAPLAGLKTAFGNSISAATGWGQAIRAVTTFSGFGDAIKSIGQTSVSGAVQIRKLGVEQEALAAKAARTQAAIGRLESGIKNYEKAIVNSQGSAVAIGSAQAQAQVDDYTKKIERNRAGIERLRNQLLGINADQYTVSNSLAQLTNKKGLASKAAGVFGSALKSAGTAAKGLIVGLGPLGVLLATVAVLTAAYGNANKNSNSILEQSQARVDALKLALEATGTATTNQEPKISGLALLWEKFSFVISDVVDTLGRLANAIFGGGSAASKANGQTTTWVDTLGRVAAAAAAGALAGGALGSVFGGIGAGPGAAIGALAFAIAALATGTDDAGVKTRKFTEALEATGSGIAAEGQAIQSLIVGLGQINDKDLDIKSTKTLAGFNQAQTALKLLGGTLDGLKLQQTGLNQEAAKLAPGVEKARAVYGKLAAAQAKVAAIQKEIDEGGGKPNLELNNAFQKASAEAGRLRQELAALANVDPNSKQYLELQTRLAAVNKQVAASQAEYDAAKKAVDDFARANGLLTTDQKETINTIGGLEEKLKTLRATLQNDLNPNATPEKWKQISAAIARTTVDLNALNDAATDSVNSELVYTIKTRIDEGEIANSAANAQRVLQALEERSTVLDIGSPALPEVLRDLETAKTKVDELDGRRADISISIFEQNGANSTVATLSQIGRYIDALEQRKVTLSIGSAEISGVIEKQNQAKLLQDAGAQSSGDLRRMIAQDYWQQELQSLQASNARQKEASAQRLSELQEQLSSVKAVADARIKAISQAGAAEQRLAQINRQELKDQAANGATEKERVSAAAQLERLDKEKEIAAIQEKAAAEEKAIQAQIRAEQKAAQEEERAFRAAQLAIQNELLNLAREETQAKIDAAKQVLEARGKAGEMATELGTGATNADLLRGSLDAGATAAGIIAEKILELDGKTITINIKQVGTQGLWTGGPTVGGETYRINELGKEGFLSSSGDLSPINKPRNALWKAPGKGMVIPAHIMSTLDVPTGRVSTGVRPSVAGSGGNGLTKIARAIQAALSQTNKPDSGLQEMAAIQANQAMQIGKLSRAVSKLADKDWNVNVGVRNTGGTAYLDALNRRM